MQSETDRRDQSVLYEPNERPPNTIAFALGFQAAMLCIAGIVITPVIVVRAAGGGEPYLSWAVFAALLVSGLTTVMQAVRVGRIGAGYILLMGTSGAFIAVCVTALAQGGPAMLATLVIISSLFQFALSTRLSLLRRIITPTVAGTVIMLIAVTVMPIVFDMLGDVPEGTPSAAAPTCTIATLFVVVVLALRVSGMWRLWVPIIGIVVGCIVASFFGLYDIQRVIEAPWIGLPAGGGWPGFDLSFGPVFWSLLPAFIFVTLVGAIETIGDSIAIQKVSWRTPRAPDFRAVQGAVTADGVGNLLSGIGGDSSKHDLFVKCFNHRTHRRCRARRRRVYWHRICGGVLSSQGVGTSSGNPQSRGRGLCDGAAGTSLCCGYADYRPGWGRLSQGDDRGRRFLDWCGVSGSGYFCGLSRRVVGGAARQWDDGWRPHGDFSDAVYGVDSTAPAAH